MELLQHLSSLLIEHANSHQGWNVLNSSPVVVEREETDRLHPAVFTLKSHDDGVIIIAQTPPKEGYTKAAEAFHKKFADHETSQQDGIFHTQMLDDAFAVILPMNEEQLDAVAENISALLIGQADKLTEFVEKMLRKIKNGQVSEGSESQSPTQTQHVGEAQSEVQTQLAGETLSVEQVIQAYLESEGYKYSHEEEDQYFTIGMKMPHYRDEKGSDTLGIAINYRDPKIVRFITPQMYTFNLEQMPYEVIASVIVWYQFRYKFLAMSLDPDDGECRISIDIPVEQGVLHTSQISRIFEFILQFAEEIHKFDDEGSGTDNPERKALFHMLLNRSKEEVRDALKKNFDEVKNQRADAGFFNQIKSDLEGLSEQQKQQVRDLIAEFKDKGDQDKGDAQGI